MGQVAHAAQLALGVVFLVAVVPKLRNPRDFRRTVDSYNVIPQCASWGTAIAVMLAEVLIACALMLGWRVADALILAIMLLVAVSIAVLVNLHRGRRIPCGCFGDPREVISSNTLVRLVVLGVTAVIVAASPRAPTTVTAMGGELAYTATVASLTVGLLLIGYGLVNHAETYFLLTKLGRLGLTEDPRVRSPGAS